MTWCFRSVVSLAYCFRFVRNALLCGLGGTRVHDQTCGSIMVDAIVARAVYVAIVHTNAIYKVIGKHSIYICFLAHYCRLGSHTKMSTHNNDLSSLCINCGFLAGILRVVTRLVNPCFRL